MEKTPADEIDDQIRQLEGMVITLENRIKLTGGVINPHADQAKINSRLSKLSAKIDNLRRSVSRKSLLTNTGGHGGGGSKAFKKKKKQPVVPSSPFDDSISGGSGSEEESSDEGKQEKSKNPKN